MSRSRFFALTFVVTLLVSACAHRDQPVSSEPIVSEAPVSSTDLGPAETPAVPTETVLPIEPELVGTNAKVIFDTDFGGDADDLGALAMLHHYVDRGFIDLLAIASWSNEEYALRGIAAVNQYYGRPKLPLGVRQVKRWRSPRTYSKIIADHFPHDEETVAAVKASTTLYREILAEADPRSITIVTVGPLANIQNLLRSPPDEISDLSGIDLVNAKVDRFVIMGGQFPDGVIGENPEWNFSGNMEGVTQDVLATIERPIVFSGYEVGFALKYGSALNQHPSDTPLYMGYMFFSGHAPWMKENYRGSILDNSSFDQTAVMLAAIGGVGEYWTLSEPGTLTADETGRATWTPNQDGQHRYLILTDKILSTLSHIASAMTHTPPHLSEAAIN